MNEELIYLTDDGHFNFLSYIKYNINLCLNPFSPSYSSSSPHIISSDSVIFDPDLIDFYNFIFKIFILILVIVTPSLLIVYFIIQ